MTEGMIILIMLGLLYILPTIIATIRKKRNLNAIGALNIFAGWTFIGYIIALVWSLMEDKE